MAWRLDGTASPLHRGEADSAGQVMSLLYTFIYTLYSLLFLCCLLLPVRACPLLSVDLTDHVCWDPSTTSLGPHHLGSHEPDSM